MRSLGRYSLGVIGFTALVALTMIVPTPARAAVAPSPPEAPTFLPSSEMPTPSVRVYSTPPAVTGGATITQMTYTASPGGKVCVTTPGTWCFFAVDNATGLSEGIDYTFTATATNTAGTSAPSAASSPFRAGPASPPGQPWVTIKQYSTDYYASVTVPILGTAAWSEGLVTASPGGFTCNLFTAPGCNFWLNVPSSSIRPAGGPLLPGVDYTFTAAGANPWGPSPTSPASAVFRFDPPTAPESFSVSRDGLGFIAVLGAPASDSGLAPTSAEIIASPGGSTTSCWWWRPGRQCRVSAADLTPGTEYTFTARLISQAGTSQPSAPSASLRACVLPDPPGTPVADPGASEVTLRWTHPARDGYCPVIGYQIDQRAGDNDWTTVVSNTGDTQPTRTVSGLAPGTTYTFRVFAITEVGRSPSPSVSSSVALPATSPAAPPPTTRPAQAPSRPRIDTARHGKTVHLRWRAVPDATSYQTRISKKDSARYGPWSPTSGPRTTFKHLDPQSRYRVQIRALNAAGAGPTVTVTVKPRR